MFKPGQLEKDDSARIKFKKEPEGYIEGKTYSIKYALAHLEEGTDPKK
jgi:hypothetical protein